MTNLLDNAGGLLGPRGSELIWSFKLNLCTSVDLPECTSGTSAVVYCQNFNYQVLIHTKT